METKFNQIAEKARTNPDLTFVSLAHLLSPKLLKESFEKLNKYSTPGIDGISYTDYKDDLEINIENLYESLKSKTYKTKPLKRGWIDKGNGKNRPLGISAIEDKIVQRAVTTLLNLIYEQDFYGFSYGFRENRNAHRALSYFRGQCMRHKIGWFINADIKGCFDNFNHKIMLEILNQRVNDGRLNWLIKQWLHTDIIDGEQRIINKSGTPQGGIISPLLANIYMHKVIDKWIVEQIKPLLKGAISIVRYADDFIICLEYQSDAERLYEVLPKRLSKYGLELNLEKSRLQNFRPENKERNNTIDYLGFTHYWAKSRAGNYIVKRKTRTKTKWRIIIELYQMIKFNRHNKFKSQQEAINRKLHGIYGYFAIRGNYNFLHLIYEKARMFWMKMLNHRGGRKKSYNSERFIKLLDIFALAKPRILHKI